MPKVLVSGGAGYIGSHMVLDLLQNGYDVVVFDNLSTGSQVCLDKVQQISSRKIEFIQGDLLRDLDRLDANDISAIIHFAAKKDVAESMSDPLKYYENNVAGTIQLLKWAVSHQVKNFVFSSTSAVYGNNQQMPLVETADVAPISAYGRSKLFTEQIISDAMQTIGGSAVILRYFNVAGNVADGSIGDPNPSPQAIIPAIIFSKLGYRDFNLKVFGTDYPTSDGTAVRDYIHVLDLVVAHRKALEFAASHSGTEVFNLGNGKGYSILELIKEFEAVTKTELAYEVANRRAGDIAVSIANPTKANELLSWQTERTLGEMIGSAWNWYRSDTFKSFRG